MPYDPELAQRLRTALQSRPGMAEKKMFGGYCWMLHGNMLCGVEVGRFMFRVGAAQEAEALARPGALVLRHRAPGGVPRHQGALGVRHLWLGHDPGHRAHRQDRMENRLVAQGRSVHRAHQGQCAQGREAGGRRRSHCLPRHLT